MQGASGSERHPCQQLEEKWNPSSLAARQWILPIASELQGRAWAFKEDDSPFMRRPCTITPVFSPTETDHTHVLFYATKFVVICVKATEDQCSHLPAAGSACCILATDGFSLSLSSFSYIRFIKYPVIELPLLPNSIRSRAKLCLLTPIPNHPRQTPTL